MKSETTNTGTNALNEHEFNYAVSQMVGLTESGPWNGIVAAIVHVSGLPDRTQAKREGDRLIRALAQRHGRKGQSLRSFKRGTLSEFASDMKLDTGRGA